MSEYSLLPHPYNPPDAVRGVTVSLTRDGNALVLEYAVEGGPLDLPPPASPTRTDELWRRTCFELFLRPDTRDGYVEFNFSPSGAWAAYAFEGYRAGMRQLPLEREPVVAWDGARASVRCDVPGVIEGARLALTAVIQEEGGPCSFWSLAYPIGPPDFHDAACFAARMPMEQAA